MTAAPELLASENRLKVLLGCTKGIVFEFDRDARYLGVWTHDEELLPRPPSKMIGRTIDEVLGTHEARRFVDAIRRVYDSGEPETLEYELLVRGGRRCFAADVVVPPPIDGRERTVVYLVRDVTAHKQLEQELRQAQKLEALGRLAGGIAHDFNNILTTILGYSDMLASDLDEESPRHRQAKRIHRAAQRAAALTQQLLAYNRQRVVKPEHLDVNGVISSMIDMLRRLIAEDIELQLDLEPDLGGVVVDRSGLEQVIMNLVLNARDALESGGSLDLSTHRVELDAAFCAGRDLEPGRHVAIVATDDGCGMDEATRARVFEPFFTTKEQGKGTGLGLSTVFGIVKQSHGHIEVESTPGRGTRFTIYLPHVPLGDAPVVADRPAVQTPDKKPTVMVVEDDEEVRQLIERYLQRAGYEVRLATSGVEAIALSQDEAIDLLITDIVMPKMGGDALAHRLRERLPKLGVLFISGYPDEGGGARVPRVDDSVFLQKPFTRTTLIARVQSLLDRGSGMLDEDSAR